MAAALAAVATFLISSFGFWLLAKKARELLVGWMRRSRRDAGKLHIVVSRLAFDEGDFVQERIFRQLRDDLGDAAQISAVPEIVDRASPSEGAEKKLTKTATKSLAILKKYDGDMLVWGAKIPDQKVVDVSFFTIPKSDPIDVPLER